MSDIQEKIDDYLGMGMEAVWVVDPGRRRAYSTKAAGTLETANDVLTVDET